MTQALGQSPSQMPRSFWLTQRNRDLRKKLEGERALVTAITPSRHVQKPSLNLNKCAQSKRNQDFLVRVFNFVQSVKPAIGRH